jgi:hypothetical protein
MPHICRISNTLYFIWEAYTVLPMCCLVNSPTLQSTPWMQRRVGAKFLTAKASFLLHCTVWAQIMGPIHRYLISRLSLQVFYLWRHVLSTAPPFILWWSNLEILFAPLHRSSPLIGEIVVIDSLLHWSIALLYGLTVSFLKCYFFKSIRAEQKQVGRSRCQCCMAMRLRQITK